MVNKDSKSPFIYLYAFFFITLIIVFLFFIFLDYSTSINLYKRYTYYFLSFNSVLYLYFIIKFLKSNSIKFANKNLFYCVKDFFSKHYIALYLSIIIMLVSCNLCGSDFRFLNNEIINVSISKSFYDTKECVSYISSINYDTNTNDILEEKIIDKPAFFPFFISIIHSLIGYRVSNFFWVNIILGILVLFSVYYLIQLKYERYYGIIGLLSFALFPSFLYFANSTCIEIFNIVFLLQLIFWLYCFIKDPNSNIAKIIICGLVLFAQIKYENIFVSLLLMIIVLFSLPKEEYKKLGYWFSIIPMASAPLCYNIKFYCNYIYESVVTNQNIRLSEYFVHNLKAFIELFFSNNVFMKNLEWTIILAFCGLFVFIKQLFFEKKQEQNNQIHLNWERKLFLYILIIFVFTLLSITAIGNISVIDSIYFLPFMVFLFIPVYKTIIEKMKLSKNFLFILFVFLFTFYWPILEKSEPVIIDNLYIPFHISQEVMDSIPDKRHYVLITSEPGWFTVFGYSAISFDCFAKYKNNIKTLLDEKKVDYLIGINFIKDKDLDFYEKDLFNDIECCKLYEKGVEQNHILEFYKYNFKSNSDDMEFNNNNINEGRN